MHQEIFRAHIKCTCIACLPVTRASFFLLVGAATENPLVIGIIIARTSKMGKRGHSMAVIFIISVQFVIDRIIIVRQN